VGQLLNVFVGRLYLGHGGNAAIPPDNGSDPLLHQAFEDFRVLFCRQHPVGMGMHIDEAGRHSQAMGIDDKIGIRQRFPFSYHGCYFMAFEKDASLESRSAISIYDQSVFNECVHDISISSRNLLGNAY
jgi:hypothetical protein